MAAIPLIGFVGGRILDSHAYELTLATAEAVGSNGWSVVCGGLGGTMEAACRGHHKGRASLPPEQRNGVVSVGILPGTDATEANPWADVVIPTGMGLARNVLIVRSASVLVAVAGQSGTLSEIAMGWQLNRPIIALQSTGGWAAQLAGHPIDDRRSDQVWPAHDAQQAVQIIRRLLPATNP